MLDGRGTSRIRTLEKMATSSSRVKCNFCPATFTKNSSRKRHESSIHLKIKPVCNHCHQEFARKDSLEIHVRNQCCRNVKKSAEPVEKRLKLVSKSDHRTNQNEKQEDPCIENRKHNKQQGFGDDLSRGFQEKNIQAPENSELSQESNTQELDEISQHGNETEDVDDANFIQNAQRQHFDELNSDEYGTLPWDNGDGTIDETLKKMFEINQHVIHAPHLIGNLTHEYNYYLARGDVDIGDIQDQLEHIYSQENNVFKITFTLGLILSHKETGELRYFYPHNNENILQEPFQITEFNDVDVLLSKIKEIDFIDAVWKHRPDTKWLPYRITNIRWVTTPTEFFLGAGVHLPEYITSKKCIISLNKDHYSILYKDKLCAFRCLAYHKCKNKRRLETYVEHYISIWKEAGNCAENGISIKSDLPLFEDVFETSINIFKLKENKECNLIYRSSKKFDSVMNLNLYGNHLSYITDLGLYTKKYKCRNCSKLFPKSNKLKRHEENCKEASALIFPGGYYKTPASIVDRIRSAGYDIPEKDRVYPYFICYDFESLLCDTDGFGDTTKLKWVSEHVAVSVSVCSNVDEYESPRCFVNTDLDSLIGNMFDYLEKIQEKASSLMLKKYEDVLNDISEISEGNDETGICNTDPRIRADMKKMKQDLEDYIQQIPLLGYNSSRYDLNLVKKKMAAYLYKDSTENSFVVKKNNAYSCIASKKFKLLDVMNYVSPGTSYDAFLKAYEVDTRKSFFPYEWFDSADKLKETELPPYECFYSQLKQNNVLEIEYLTYQKKLSSGCSKDRILDTTGSREQPKTGRENYESLLEIWKEHKMTTFSDFLKYYNNLDVKPFVQAVDNMLKFYIKKGIDLFKETISVPGVARKLMMKLKDKDSHFSLFSKQYRDIYMKIKENIVGGPSIIFHRYHKAGVTKIRGEKLCRNIVGYDANALYLWSIAQKMPTGPFTVRRCETKFKKEKQDRYLKEWYYLEWISHKHDREIQHKFNGGQRRIGPYFVDGISGKDIYEFNGCYFHAHECCLTTNVKSEKWWKEAPVVRERHQQRKAFLEEQGYNVTEIYECEYNKAVQDNQELSEFLTRFERPCDRYSNMSESKILEAIRADKLFGAVEVDIHVPDNLVEHFSEMCPIFCTTEVPVDKIGTHMQEHIRENELSNKPRKLLVGGLRAEKILLATPLLKWYLDHGLKVTKIYTVIEYDGRACFQAFVDAVSSARREGDVNKAKSCIADTMKLIGNSGYGSVIMDKFRHVMIKYFTDEHQARLAVNDRHFRKLEELDVNLIEMESAKRIIKLDLPNQVGFFILQYAKLRMLAFYYDFLDVFLDRKDFQMVEMDTDSNYFALSKETLDEAIRPSMLTEYRNVKDQWLPRTDTQEHKAFDKRTPGLFKLEYQGTEIAALCSKTYCVYDEKRNNSKFSCKGINKSNYTNPMDVYTRVLNTKQHVSGHNIGFRAHCNSVYTYTQERVGFSYFYAKREVLQDGVTTIPLDLTLKPPRIDTVK